MADGQVKATISGPILFLSSGQWAHALASLKERLPLRNLHWKSSARPAIRTVQELDVTLLLLDSVRDEPASQIPVTLLEKPLLNIFFFSCEDADAYKNSVKKQIKDWHTLVSQRRNQEWLIVLVVRPETQSTSNRLFQRASILDKVKSDFNMAKRDRCVQLAWAVGSDDPGAWSDLLSKMKEGILSTFDAHIMQREEEVRRSETQRQMPGWNFCTFFILKESLAYSFEGLNLIEEAQIQYDELEASFFQVLKEQNLSWFGHLGGTALNDDSAPLLSITKKPYRDMMLSNTITIFDFRSYLLARQCFLLSKLGKIAEAASKAARFVTTFARTLRENESDLSEFFIESWMYSAAFNIVDTCEEWAQAANLDSSAMLAFHAIKAGLLELARCQLDKIGIVKGHIPAEAPFTISRPAASAATNNSSGTAVTPSHQGPPISRLDLLEVLNDRDAFDRLYIATTHRAIQTYGSCGRKRFTLKLHDSLASLDQCRGRYSSAHSIFSSLPSYYVSSKWTSLEGFTLSQSIECRPEAEQPLDTDWVTQAVAFLKTYIADRTAPTLCKEATTLEDQGFAGKNVQEQRDYLAGIVKRLQEAGGMLSENHAVQGHPAFVPRLTKSDGRLVLTEDGSLVDITVLNALPAEVLVDKIEVTLTGREQEELIFSSSMETVLPPGITVATLSNPIPSSGLFVLKSAVLRMGRIVFHYNHSTAPKSIKQQVVRLPKDPAAVDVQVGFPHQVVLDATASVTVTLSTGRNHLVDAVMSFSNPGQEVNFHTENAQLLSGEVDSVEFMDNTICIKNVVPRTLLRFNLPYSGLRVDLMKVQVHVKYLTATTKTPEQRRTIKRTRTVNTALPLAVNVQDYFRGQRLFSKFRISCASEQPLRIRDAVLQNKSTLSSLRISRCRRADAVPETITPMRPAYYLFCVESESGGQRQDNSGMSLLLTFRTLREDAETTVTDAINHACSQRPSMADHRAWMWHMVMTEVDQHSAWADTYGSNGNVDLRHIPWGEKCSAAGLSADVAEAMESVVETLAQGRTERTHLGKQDKGDWRTLCIPVDVPILSILNAARISIASGISGDSIYAGQSLQAILSIKTTLHWGQGSTDDQHLLRFDINAEGEGNWLVSGPKRGEYVAKDDSTLERQITLVPLRYGSLSLPKVSVVPVMDPGNEYPEDTPSCETHQMHAAERVSVLPRSARATYIVDL
ncbi:hypothetical protein FRB95_010533 [Tulasnella sp. JGI-2019a]|nr:hypothetical protein FRB95_010533 [Tulasnella sp. JGI-2019a]